MLFLVQINLHLLCYYTVYRQKTVCANESQSHMSNNVFLTPWVIFRTFAQNRSPLD